MSLDFYDQKTALDRVGDRTSKVEEFLTFIAYAAYLGLIVAACKYTYDALQVLKEIAEVIKSTT